MKTLHIIVSDKVASYLQRDGYIVCGNSDYQVEFSFSSEWDAYTKKTARFIWGGKPRDVEFSGNVCPVPIVANTEELKVGVYVENLSTTTSAVIPCRLSVLCDSKAEAEGTVVVPEGTPVLVEKTFNANGEYPATNYGADGFSKVKINVPTEIPEGFIKPTGTIDITEKDNNKTVDVSKYASARVNIPTGSGEDIPDHTDSDFTLHYTSKGSGELGIVYSSSEKVAFEAAPEGAEIDTLQDQNFVPSNIKKDVVIFGVKGEYEGSTKQNYCLVRFYNDDRTTLLYEIVVPYGSSAVYAGDAPASSLGADYTFTGFEPSTESVTADMDCYAVYDEPVAEIGTLEETLWANISAVSEAGTAANYFAVGDTKAVTLNGNVGAGPTLNNATYYVYILGFDHNSELEGNGIHFGTFKTADGTDICLADNKYNQRYSGGDKHFNLHHWGDKTYGGWKGCDLRYDVLGSTDVAPSGYGALIVSGRVGYDATATCATNPVADTLMAALPSDLRAVMKPMTKYTDNTGNGTAADVTAAIDYLPLLAEYEVQGEIAKACVAEKTKQAQYAYFSAGNSKAKSRFVNDTIYTAAWHTRSVNNGSGKYYVGIDSNGASIEPYASSCLGIAPIFKV